MESKKCCSPVTCCGMPMEKGCLIFSIINAVLCGISLLASLGFLIACLLLVMVDDSVFWLTIGVCIVCCVGFTTGFIFAIVLCVGLKKNKTRYIMVYLVYAIVAVILSVLGTLVYLWLVWGEVQHMMLASIPIGICVIYSVMLLLVYQTYEVLSARSAVTGHRRLLNVDC